MYASAPQSAATSFVGNTPKTISSANKFAGVFKGPAQPPVYNVRQNPYKRQSIVMSAAAAAGSMGMDKNGRVAFDLS